MEKNKLYYGAAYYDEYMPESRVEQDMLLMKDAGMNLIRIAESTWSTWEPRDGEFDFSSLHRVLQCASDGRPDTPGWQNPGHPSPSCRR